MFASLVRSGRAALRAKRTLVGVSSSRAFSAAASGDVGDLDNQQDEPLYEIRTYQLKPEHLMDYLALTGSEAFHPRTEASKLCAFFNVELGSVLCNSVVHFWRYDDLDHRTEVRAALASDAGFGKYIETIRPWLVSQEAVLTRGFLDEDFIESAAAGSGKYMLQSFNGEDLDAEDGEFDGDNEDSLADEVGAFDTVVGDTSSTYKLLRAPGFQDLLEHGDITLEVHDSVLLVPTPFSPAQ